MSLKPTHNPQRGPAQALLELLTEHPELPSLTWNIASDGILRGNLHGADVHDVAQLWAGTLGYDLDGPFGYRFPSASRAFQAIHMVWRDVELYLGFYSEATAYPELLAVAS